MDDAPIMILKVGPIHSYRLIERKELPRRYLLASRISYGDERLLSVAFNAEPLRGKQVENATREEFPFIASLQHRNRYHFCSGVLIAKQHVITAAHCLRDKTANNIWIGFGFVNVGSSVRHSVYSWLTYDVWADRQGTAKDAVIHDIAIIKLLSSVNINPIDLSYLKNQQIQGKRALIFGWSENKPEELQKASVKVLSDEDCSEKVRFITNNIMEIHSTILCTFADPYVLLERSDSGGPLIGKDHGLLGINVGDAPNVQPTWGNFTLEFLKKYRVNIHSSVDYYRNFILSALTRF